MAPCSLGDWLCALVDGATAAAAVEAPAGRQPASVCFSPLSQIGPGLVVPAAGGRMTLPLQEEQAAALEAVCSLAPFGQGEATVTNPAVRHTYHLDPSAFELNNPREPRRGSHAGLASSRGCTARPTHTCTCQSRRLCMTP